MKVEHTLDCDDDGHLTLVTTAKLGHVDDVNPEAIPPDVWDAYLEFVSQEADAQRYARECEATANDAFNDRFGDFNRGTTR